MFLSNSLSSSLIQHSFIQQTCRSFNSSYSARLILSHQSSNHAVKVKEEKDQVAGQLDERLLLVFLERSENLSGVQQMGVCVDLVGVVGEDGGIEQQHDPMAGQQKDNGQSSVSGGLGQHVVIEPIAQVDRVDVIALQVRVHDCEENLQKQVHQRNEDGKDEGVRVGSHSGCGEERGL